jgi:hypothetical protein
MSEYLRKKKTAMLIKAVKALLIFSKNYFISYNAQSFFLIPH